MNRQAIIKFWYFNPVLLIKLDHPINNQWYCLFQKFIIKHFSLISFECLNCIQCKVPLLIVIVLLLGEIDLFICTYVLLLVHEHRLIKYILCKPRRSLSLCVYECAIIVSVSLMHFYAILLMILVNFITLCILLMIQFLFLLPNRMLHFYYYVLF